MPRSLAFPIFLPRLLVPALVLLAAVAAHSAGDQVERVSGTYNGAPPVAGAGAWQPAMSADGRYLAFVSDAENYTAVPGDVPQIFLRDLAEGRTELLSRTTDGTPANKESMHPSMSADGRFVVFGTDATNLDASGRGGVYLRDCQAGITQRIDYGRNPVISADGRFVAYEETHLWLYDRQSGQREQLNVDTDWGSLTGFGYAISPNARYAVFSEHTPGTRTLSDLYVRDRSAGTTRKIEARGDAWYSPVVSDNGTVVLRAFGTIWEAATGQRDAIPYRGGRPALSPDGRQVAFLARGTTRPDDGGDATGAYLFNRDTRVLERLSVPVDGTNLHGPAEDFGDLSGDYIALSPDSRFVVFSTVASNLVSGDINGRRDVFVLDRQAGTTTWASRGTGKVLGTRPAQYSAPVLSADGRFVAFGSDGLNLVPGDTNGAWDAFVRDRSSGTLERVSLASDGSQGEGDTCAGYLDHSLTISGDGRFVAFVSEAANLAPGSVFFRGDVFLRDRLHGTTVRPSALIPNSRRVDQARGPALSVDGRWLALSVQLLGGPYPSTVLLYDCALGKLEWPLGTMASWDAGGSEPGLSADGRYLCWSTPVSRYSYWEEVMVRDRLRGTTESVTRPTPSTRPNEECGWPRISADGRWVVFSSRATNLVPGDTNRTRDVFLSDRLTGTIKRINLSETGEQLPAGGIAGEISADGRFISLATYTRQATYNGHYTLAWGVYDRYRDRVEWLRSEPEGPYLTYHDGRYPSFPNPALSADGRHVGFVGQPDPNRREADVWVWDRQLSGFGGRVTTSGDVEFGALLRGRTRTLTLYVRNQSQREAVHVSAATAPPFAIRAETEAIIPPGGYTAFRVGFRPTKRGRVAGTVRLTTTNPEQPEIDVPVAGVGF